jgi:hypothetical protein
MQKKKKSTSEKILVELLKGLVRHVSAPPPSKRPAAPQPTGPLGGCGGCKGRQ